MARPGALVLEDGSVFLGELFGAEVAVDGEVVFNTCLTGYQEVCTDPSYRGQMVVMTHPQIGNYGVAPAWSESRRPWLAALIVRDLAPEYSHWAASEGLSDYLARHAVPGLQGVDTRALVRRLRARGTLRAVLRPGPPAGFSAADLDALRAEARAVLPLEGRDVVAEVVGHLPIPAAEAGPAPTSAPALGSPGGAPAPRVAVIDCGAKGNIVRSLLRRGLTVAVVPPTASAAEVLAAGPDGVVISNGPGDPERLTGLVQTVRELVRSGRPVFGICLGHQLLGLAAGARTSRIGYGHHGGNHPVKDLRTGRVYITSQNHEFQVVGETLPPESGFRVSHVNVNDGTVEGLEHAVWPVFSVQYHPEGCPGPQDNQYLFDRFAELVRMTKEQAAARRDGPVWPEPPHAGAGAAGRGGEPRP